MPKIQAPTIVAHRELRRQQLMGAAMELAIEGGAEAITVSAVAQKAGLSRSSIYEYFSSSADLIADLVLEELDYYTVRLADAIKDATDPFEKIELWIAEGLRYVEDGRHMLVKSLNTVSTPEFRKEEISLGHRRLISPLRQALSPMLQACASMLEMRQSSKLATQFHLQLQDSEPWFVNYFTVIAAVALRAG